MHGVCVIDKKWGGRGQLGLAFVIRRINAHVKYFSVHFASMIDSIVLKAKYFWTLKKTKITEA